MGAAAAAAYMPPSHRKETRVYATGKAIGDTPAIGNYFSPLGDLNAWSNDGSTCLIDAASSITISYRAIFSDHSRERLEFHFYI